MRSFADLEALIRLLPAQVVTRLSAIDIGRRSEVLYRDQMPGLLTDLTDRARVVSITASSTIEGVIANAYAIFANRAAAAQSAGTKQHRVREHILHDAPTTFRLADLRTAVPGVSDQTFRLVPEQLRGKARCGPTEPAAQRPGPVRMPHVPNNCTAPEP